MLTSAAVARPGRHATAGLALRVVSSNVTRPRAGPSHFHYPCASAYNNILLRRQYSTPTPSSSPSTSSSAGSSSTDAPPPVSQSEAQKKSKLDMRPAPIKPKPPSSTATATNAKGKVNAADALKAAAPPTRKSASNMKQLKAKSPYYAEKDKVASSKPEEMATATPLPPPPPSQQQTGADASKDAPLSGLGAAKAEAMEAVKEAQAHGILKPPPEGANWARRTMHQAWELAKFYFRGIKLVWERSKTVREIHARIRGGGARLTREEFRLMSTQEEDVRKIVPFLLIALILEEIIPLIAIYAPGMLPSTCVLPSQRRSIETKRAEKAAAFRKQYSTAFGELKKLAQMRTVEGREEGKRPLMYLIVDTNRLEEVKDAPTAICGLLGLSTLGPDFMRVRRIKMRLEFLRLDDHLLLIEKTKANMMSDRDLAEALQERGIPNLATSSRTQLNSTMDGWLTQAIFTSNEDESSRRLALILTHA